MKEPKIFFVARHEIAEMGITFPSGKIITMVRGGTYQTEDPEEIDFLLEVKGIGYRDLDDKEFKSWVQTRYQDLPRIDHPEIKTVEDVAEFLWKDPIDKLILMHLEKNGYIVTHPKPEGTQALDLDQPISNAPLASGKPKSSKPKTGTKKSGKK